MRRDAPGAAARGYVERLEAELKRDNELEKRREPNNEHLDMEILDVGILKRKDDVESMWERGTEGLVELGKIPGLLANLERAEKAVDVVRGM